MTTSTPRIEDVRSTAYTIPTDQPESDGTLKWDSTTLLLVQAKCGQTIGLGYTYADSVTATLICEKLAPLATGADAFDIPRVHAAMVREMRNLGRTGISAMAISAVDNALWDLKAKLLGLPLFKLLGAVRDSYPIYGSGGFTSYSHEKLAEQLGGWVAQGDWPGHGTFRRCQQRLRPQAGAAFHGNIRPRF